LSKSREKSIENKKNTFNGDVLRSEKAPGDGAFFY